MYIEIIIHIHIYVYSYVCMYVHMYVCTYVYMYVIRIYVCMYGLKIHNESDVSFNDILKFK